MVVKSKRGRTRYVVFRVETGAPPSRRDVTGALHALATRRTAAGEALEVRLTAFEDGVGALRVTHREVERALALLGEIRWLREPSNAARFVPLGVSGTLRAARRKWMTPRPATQPETAPRES